MSLRSILSIAVAAAGLTVLAASPTIAGGSIIHGGGFTFAGGGNGGHCHGGGGGHVVKIINFNKNLNINNNVNVNKNININKNIVIAKSNSFSIAVAGAAAGAAGSSSSGSYSESVTVNRGGEGAAVSAAEACEMQEGSLVKAIHAVCVSAEGREFPASHMLPETWIDTAYEGEIARCIPGATVKVTVGDVVESEQGLAGTYDQGEVLACGRGEALWHYKNGMVKCAPATPVKDCTERTNLRKYGTGDFFFSYRSKVCVNRVASSRSSDLSSTTFDGGVGDSGY